MSDKTSPSTASAARRGYVTLTVGNQLFGIPVLDVMDILRAQRVTKVPQSSAEIAGVLNLRGRIVTAIDLRIKVGLPDRSDGGEKMHVVIEYNGEPYGLVVDTVGDVMELDGSDWELAPRNLDQRLATLSTGVYRLSGRLLVILDIPRVLTSCDKQAA